MRKKRESSPYPQIRPLWLAIFSDIIGFSLLITVYPELMQEFNVTPLAISLISAVNGLFSFISAPIWGKLSDRLGRKPMLLLSQIGTIIGFIILAFSGNLWMIAISRIVDGIFGGNFPIAKAVINDVVEPKHMAREMTTMGVAHNVANLFGPALGGLLFNFTGLLGPGLGAALTAIFAFMITAKFLPETAPIKTNSTKNISEINHQEEFLYDGRDVDVDVDIDDGSEISAENPSYITDINQKWYDDKALVLAILIFGFTTFGFMIMVSNLAMFGSIQFELDAQLMGLFLTIGAIFQILVRYTIYNPLLKRWGEYRMVMVGFIIYLIAYFFMAFITQKWQFLLLLIANSFATSGTRGGLSSFVSNLARPHERGKIQGILSSLDTFAQIIGPILGGVMLTYFSPRWFPSVSWSFMLVAMIVLIGATPLHHALHQKDIRIPEKRLMVSL